MSSLEGGAPFSETEIAAKTPGSARAPQIDANQEDEDDSSDADWIKLEGGKAFSRLLYPNPVCFLTTRSPIGEGTTTNVMVLSWLTATNNEGRFAFSLNRRRHTASYLVPEIDDSDVDDEKESALGAEFVLSVPVQGMERLVLDVGGTSGRWGSKFAEERSTVVAVAPTGENLERSTKVALPANKQKKKLRLVGGVPGLRAVPLGGCSSPGTRDGIGPSDLFAVKGTVAHLRCRTYQIIGNAPGVVDKDHYLILSEVLEAHVRSSHWDSRKNQFRPRDGALPYLTFLGSQTFGYVTC